MQNLARALQALGERGFLRVGLDSDGPSPLDETELGRGGVALVLGAEGKGLRQLTRDTCRTLGGVFLLETCEHGTNTVVEH